MPPQQGDRYRILFDHSADAMLLIEGDRFVDFNQATLDMLGYKTRQELFSAHPSQLSPEFQPDGRPSFEKANEMIQKALKEGSNRFVWMHTRKNGENFPVEVLLTAVPYEGDNLLHVVWRDISKRVRIEEENERHRDHLQELVNERTKDLEKALEEASLLSEAVNQSGTSVLITDAMGRIEYVNQAFTEINGYTLDEVAGETPRILSSGGHTDAFYQDMWDTILRGDVWSDSILNRRKNGETYWARARIAPVRDKQGKISKFVGVEADISELMEQKEQAEAANRAKSEFLSSMSHELRTPLNAILGFSQLLQMGADTPLTERQDGYVDQVLKAGRHLLSLIDEVLDLARIEAGKLNLSMEAVNLDDLVEECVGLTKPQAETKQVQIHLTRLDNPPQLNTDRLRAKQSLLNLLSNAVKYNVEKGTISVAEEIGKTGRLKISVTDTGPGIPKDRQIELFSPFNRLGAETSDIEGTGIGLVLTKRLMEEMGGEIGFSSEEGRGSTFWIEFPIAKAATDQPVRPDHGKARELILDGQKKLLLYVEDNPANLALMESIVEGIHNLSLISAPTGELGYSLAETHNPDIIILDINLPGMDGCEAVRLLKSRKSTEKIPVLALSADDMPRSVERGLKAGFDDYLTKPIDVPRLMEAIRAALENRTKKGNAVKASP